MTRPALDVARQWLDGEPAIKMWTGAAVASLAALLEAREREAYLRGFGDAREMAVREVDVDVCGGDSHHLRRHWAALIRALAPPEAGR